MIICLCVFSTQNIDQAGGPETFKTLLEKIISFPCVASTTAKLLAFLIDPLIKLKNLKPWILHVI